jgi:DNA-binding helix-hairpin-helix protein with protein kinase domain
VQRSPPAVSPEEAPTSSSSHFSPQGTPLPTRKAVWEFKQAAAAVVAVVVVVVGVVVVVVVVVGVVV